MGGDGMSGTVLLTGATGFLGSQVARQLLRDTDCTLLALVRGDGTEMATQRLARAWSDWPELAGAIGGRVRVLCGDISSARLGLDGSTYDELARQVTHIVHVAADLRLNGPIDELRVTNVQGVANVLELARAARRSGVLERLAHVSTAYVAGCRAGPVPEDALSDAFGFSSSYEQSKYEGELLVQGAREELPISIFRPGMIVGDSHTGAIQTFNTVYIPLRLYLTGKLPVLPASPRLRINLVPVDYVARAIARLTFDPRAAGLTFHLTAPDASLPTAGELVEVARQWAKERLDVHLPRLLFLPLPVPRRQYRPGRTAPEREHSLVAPLSALLPYLNGRQRFGRDNVDRLLGPYELRWREFFPRLLEYAVYAGFLHRSGRTVHEQVLFRLERRSRRVTYHDAVEGRFVTRSARQVRRDILDAVRALRALGVCPGDRVAIVGLNSTRYLALDVAIGLTGAVSVPLYYTSPPADVDAILQASGAKLLLIGVPGLLEHLDELCTWLRAGLPIVSFCRDRVPEGLPCQVISWDEFLALGAAQSASTARVASTPVGFGDLATLRYTSGTTGQPKGVMFHHAHLRWIAECTASLLPWKARNRAAAWLSCLPMNHVVEGILATYSPYYVPAPVDIYFLEDIHDLSRALPRVRPTIFFSVPRVYEKVWEAFAGSGPGRLYLSLRKGFAGQVLRPVVRWILLRKAGFDRCAQLIVGSAPAAENLLRAYHDLGIEVHNAYGLTEAPLVALNRLGANQIGTVGQPLPDTEVRVAEDGEVLVRGPQVTVGYFRAGSPCHDGWLRTGDLGRQTGEGKLVIIGRKKELIKTSYGKYVHPAKVETLLKEIPGVAEAMLAGEGKPYCTALLWTVGNGRGRPSPEAIDRAILEVNARLSHPEQVKQWAILPGGLSIEGGHLTANLKLKRQVVAQQFSTVLDALYRGESLPGDTLHVGRALRERVA
jgi:long-chain acyl-CoA synthetase